MIRDEKLSIIIPAYNAENHIERCLDSILNQDFHNEVEIIVVNDGSTDSTGLILERYHCRYPSVFKIVTKDNGGVPSARNAGLEVADGEWVWFCDADDYICKNGLSYVIDNFVDDDIDICTFYSITLDCKAMKSFKEPLSVSGKSDYYGSTLSFYDRDYPRFVWNHLYRRSKIMNIRFRDVTMCEDMVFNLEVYMQNLQIRCTNANIYRYTVSPGQLTKRRDLKTELATIRSYELLFDMSKGFQGKYDDNNLKAGIDKMIADQFTPFMSRLLNAKLSRMAFLSKMNTFRAKGILPICETNRTNMIINFVCRNSFLYPLASVVYMYLFIPYILPKLSRN